MARWATEEAGPAIDLNADVGEGTGAGRVGDDEGLIPLITSANVACGFHGGDPTLIRQTVELAKRYDVRVGAHPGYPDRVGFGRRAVGTMPAEIEADVLYQIGALRAFVEAAGMRMQHVKLHGALYHRAVEDAAVARAVARVVTSVDRSLILVGLAGSAILEAGRQEGLRVAAEGFADRAYRADGRLVPRGTAGAVITDRAQALEQALGIVRGRIKSAEGTEVVLEVDTICVHGDTPGAVEMARHLRAGLERAGVALRPLEQVLAC